MTKKYVYHCCHSVYFIICTIMFKLQYIVRILLRYFEFFYVALKNKHLPSTNNTVCVCLST